MNSENYLPWSLEWMEKNELTLGLTYLFTQVNRPHASLQIVPNDLGGFTAVWITGPENGISKMRKFQSHDYNVKDVYCAYDKKH